MTKYIMRVEGVAPNMKWGCFQKLMQLFARKKITPLVGIIPDNKDPALLQYEAAPVDFWQAIRDGKQSGWTLAMHGYQHLLRPHAGGRLKLRPCGEFPGLTVGQQERMLEAGLKIFAYHGLDTEVFMPPAHGYDKSTLRAMRQVGMTTLTDGLSPLPYRQHGILCVPQQVSTLRTMPMGVITFNLCPNTMTDQDIKKVGQFIDAFRSDIIDFPSAKEYAASSFVQRPLEAVITMAMKTSGGRTRENERSPSANDNK